MWGVGRRAAGGYKNGGESFGRYSSREAIEVRGGKELCWRKNFRGLQQQVAIEVRVHRSRGRERAVLEREFSWDSAAGAIRGAIEVGDVKGLCWREGYSSRRLLK